MSISSAVRRTTRRLGLSLAAVASLTGAAVFAATPSSAGTSDVIMPPTCSNHMHLIDKDANYTTYTYTDSGRVISVKQGKFSYGGSFEQPRSFTEVMLPGRQVIFLSVRQNGELWKHTLTSTGNSGTRIASRWGGITKIVGTDNGIFYAVTSTGGLNAYRTADGVSFRTHDIIGTKGWTTLKSISGYARTDGNDSLVAVNAAGELVDYIITPDGATRASYPTNWKVGISQVSVGDCADSPGRPIFVVVDGVMKAYHDRDALNGPHNALQDLNNAGRIGAGWVGLLS